VTDAEDALPAAEEVLDEDSVAAQLSVVLVRLKLALLHNVSCTSLNNSGVGCAEDGR
jgi:hypothetical protein